MADELELFERRLDQYIDRYAEDIGYAGVEAVLQERAQDMRELSAADPDAVQITADDLDGWSAGSE